jgi:trans-4-hydroxy-L-proline dehydratase
MTGVTYVPKVKEPYNLSPRIKWLYDYYFMGTERNWNNEFLAFTTGTKDDWLFEEMNFYIVPEVYSFFNTFNKTFNQNAVALNLPDDFYSKGLAERKAIFTRKAMIEGVPVEILPGDLIAGSRFNIVCSKCWTSPEAKKRHKLVLAKGALRDRLFAFKDMGFGNCGPTSGHLIADYPRILKIGFKGLHSYYSELYDELSDTEKRGQTGSNLKAMIDACLMPAELAAAYSAECLVLADRESNAQRKAELQQMAENLKVVPWKPAENFWQAVQSLWLTHMLIMADENYPGPGVSFGRLDQYLLPYWQKSMADGLDIEFGKDILKCFWIHCNTAYDAMIRTGNNQGITAGYGQLFNLSGMGRDGIDLTNELTYILLEVIDEMNPILEPKPNVRLHRNTPDELLDKVVEMIAHSQGAPFLLNFDERSMAGLLRQAEKAGCQDLINENNVFDYAAVGCLENTMCGNDRSATVDCNLNLYKAVELTLGGGKELQVYTDSLWGKPYRPTDDAPKTGDPATFKDFEQFYKAFEKQIAYIVKKMADLYDKMDAVRAEFSPTPYLSTLVRGCAEKGLDVTQGGAELKFITIEAVTFATTVDSLLAVKYLVFDQKLCTMEELIRALKANWAGFEKLQAAALYRAPKFGRDDDTADQLARRVMDSWTEETWHYKTKSTGAQFRPGMLSWNYWISSGYILPASPDGRKKGQFLSNAICPVNGADIKGPTANANSVGIALGGHTGSGDYLTYCNSLPNGASHTITLNPALVKSPEHKEKLKAFLKGYAENGGTALQINIIDADTLRDAQAHPENYRNLLVRVTGYNAYFASIGRELQDEIIARESHKCL